jgi:hypothetical protein
VTVDQGETTIYEVDRLIIPAGHNFDSLSLALQYSTDNFGSDVNDAATWVQSGTEEIDKEFTAQTKRYWRLRIISPSAYPELTEMFLTKSYTFQRNPNYGCVEGYKDNVYRQESQSGIAYKVELGDLRKYRKYSLTKISLTQRTDIEAAGLHLGMTLKPLYLEDLQGDLFFAELLNPLQMTMEHENRYGTELEALEVIGRIVIPVVVVTKFGNDTITFPEARNHRFKKVKLISDIVRIQESSLRVSRAVRIVNEFIELIYNYLKVTTPP